MQIQISLFHNFTFNVMDRVIIIFAVIGTLMFAAYMYFIIKTSYDDEKLKKKEKLEEARKLEEEEKLKLNGKK